jgi:hypothetical protein
MNLMTNSDMTTLLPHSQHPECVHAYRRSGSLCGKNNGRKSKSRIQRLSAAPPQAPAAGRLAAAMATICASLRPIRDGAVRSNARTCAISFSFDPGQRPGHPKKMVFGG